MDPKSTIDAVLETFGDVSVAESGECLVVVIRGGRARIPIVLEIGGDVARVLVGRIAIALPFEDAGDGDHLLAVVQAIQDGGAAELIAVTPSGAHHVGHSLVGDGFEYIGGVEDPSLFTTYPV